MRTVACLTLAMALVLGSRLSAADPKPDDKPVPTKDAAAKMTVPPGFKVTLFAGEPDIVQPIAFTFDDRGRMWVVECLSYPKWTKDGTGHDRVVILEDTNGDGTFDKKTVFMDNGSNLSGIELGFGGVWLCSSPNLLFVPILEGDKPGKAEVKLDGWNMIDTKHNIFNSLVWGPDGWLYGCNGIQAKAWVGTPGTPKEKRPYMDCGVWRYHPTRKVFEPVAHGTTNPFGLDFDEYGEIFITNCVIDHLFHFVPGGHYERMYGQDANPHAYGLMKSCVDYRHWGSGAWTDSRANSDGSLKKEHSDAGGGHAHSGCAIYLGDNFPKEYRNTLFTANIHGNRLNNDGLERTKSGYKGVRRPDFLFANDSWFRGICVKTGPDGALYVSDWCDTGECHNYDRADTSNGRIYRVSYGDPKQWKGDVSKLTDAELVKMQTHANDWFVRKARRVLQERAAGGKVEKGTVEALRELLPLREGVTVAHSLHGAWALEAMGMLRGDDLVWFSEHSDPIRKAWAYRLIASDPVRAAKFNPGMRGRREDLRDYYCLMNDAAGLPRLTPAQRAEAAEVLVRNPGFATDDNLAQLLWYGVAPWFEQDTAEAVRAIRDTPVPLIRANGVRLLLSLPEATQRDALAKLIVAAGKARDPGRQAELFRNIRAALAGRKDVTPPAEWAGVFETSQASKTLEVVREAEALAVLFGDKGAIASLTKRIGDATAKVDDRRAAVELLAPRKLPDFGKTLRTLLDDSAVRPTAIRALAAYPDAETPAAILKAYPKFTAEEKLDAVQTLAARKEWANALLDAIEKKELPRSDVPVTTARQIVALNDKALSTRLDTVWGKIAPASQVRVALTKKWKDLLTEPVLAKANTANGRALFTKHCAACHKMFGEGQSVGPELTGSQRSNLDYVLENVLDPSAVVPNEFRMVNFTTKDDRVISGIVLRETKDAVTIRTTNEQVILPTADIAGRKQTNVSIMPDGLFDQMKPDEVRDLIAYLRAKEQVPVPK